MKKTYGMRNTKECVLKIQKGKATIVCPFTGGNLQSREPIPATYTTDNPVIQGVIETTPMFANGKIYVASQYGEPEEVVVVAEKPAAKKTAKKNKPEPRVKENVRTFGDAMTVLMTEAEVNISELKTIEDCVKKAEELGISFPNIGK